MAYSIKFHIGGGGKLVPRVGGKKRDPGNEVGEVALPDFEFLTFHVLIFIKMAPYLEQSQIRRLPVSYGVLSEIFTL